MHIAMRSVLPKHYVRMPLRPVARALLLLLLPMIIELKLCHNPIRRSQFSITSLMTAQAVEIGTSLQPLQPLEPKRGKRRFGGCVKCQPRSQKKSSAMHLLLSILLASRTDRLDPVDLENTTPSYINAANITTNIHAEMISSKNNQGETESETESHTSKM
jgi:hypothetical protein